MRTLFNSKRTRIFEITEICKWNKINEVYNYKEFQRTRINKQRNKQQQKKSINHDFFWIIFKFSFQ